jgi:acyl-CoA thioesterase superfamily protein/acyl-Coa thioesterase superfamily protein
MIDAFFALSDVGRGEVLTPRDPAASHWGGPSRTVRGVAVSGALAREVERVLSGLDGAAGFHPARWTLDLFRPTFMRPVVASARVVRQGRRLCLIDALLTQDDKPVARAGALFLTPGGQAHGKTFSGDQAPSAPPARLRPHSSEPRLYFSADIGWTTGPDGHTNASRKQIWNLPTAVVDGAAPSPFQQAAMVADLANMVGNWGDAGVQFINADVTLALARQPTETEIGLSAEHRVEHDGIAVATALMFDRAGVLGSVTVTAVANGQHAVDPRRVGLQR